MNNTIHYLKKSQFWCEEGGHDVKGEGYLYNGRPVCLRHYEMLFPKFKAAEAKKFKRTEL